MADIRFAPESGHRVTVVECPLRAKFCLTHCNIFLD